MFSYINFCFEDMSDRNKTEIPDRRVCRKPVVYSTDSTRNNQTHPNDIQSTFDCERYKELYANRRDDQERHHTKGINPFLHNI